MSIFVVDVEADGPVPGLYSMVSFAAVKLTPELNTTFKALTCPISEKYDNSALNSIHVTRDDHLTYPEPRIAIHSFAEWIKEHNKGRAVLISDNPAFDWQFVNYYTHFYLGYNPFGFTARRIGDLYSGAVQDFSASSKWKKLIKTPHTHDPLDDAIGNAEALLEIGKQFNLKFPE